MTTYWVQIQTKRKSLPLLSSGLTREAAERLYQNVAEGWTLRRLGSSEGEIVLEERKEGAK
jgi:hypothetical protein